MASTLGERSQFSRSSVRKSKRKQANGSAASIMICVLVAALHIFGAKLKAPDGHDSCFTD